MEHARRTVAERVARILERAEKEISDQEAASAPTSPTPQPVRAAEPVVREGLPDFDQPAETSTSAPDYRRHRNR